MTLELAGQLFTFLGVVLGFLFQYLRESRQHKWDADDRRAVAAQIQLTHEKTAVRLAVETSQAEARLTQHIADNTSISVKAFETANNINEKIYSLGVGLTREKSTASLEAEPVPGVGPTRPLI